LIPGWHPSTMIWATWAFVLWLHPVLKWILVLQHAAFKAMKEEFKMWREKVFKLTFYWVDIHFSDANGEERVSIHISHGPRKVLAFWKKQFIHIVTRVAKITCRYIHIYIGGVFSNALYIWITQHLWIYRIYMRLHHLYECTHLCESNPHLRVYLTSTYLPHLYVSTPHLRVYPPLRVYSTFTCLPPLRVYSTFTCLPTFMCLPHLYVSTPHSRVYPPLRVYPSFTYVIQFRIHGEFENENKFAFSPCICEAATHQIIHETRPRPGICCFHASVLVSQWCVFIYNQTKFGVWSRKVWVVSCKLCTLAAPDTSNFGGLVGISLVRTDMI